MDFIHGEIMDDWNHGWFIVIFMGIWCLDAYFFWVQPKIHRSRSHFVGGPSANLTITKCLGRNRIRTVAIWVQGGDRFYSQRRCQNKGVSRMLVRWCVLHNFQVSNSSIFLGFAMGFTVVVFLTWLCTNIPQVNRFLAPVRSIAGHPSSMRCQSL